MKKFKSFRATALAAAVVVSLAFPSPSRGRATARSGRGAAHRGPTVRLPGHVMPALAGAVRVAPATHATSGRRDADGEPLTLTVVLRRDDQVGFERYLHALYEPGTPSYRRFLSQRAIADRFGPSPRTYKGILRYLRANGFQLAEGSTNRLTLTVHGTRRGAERAFGVQLHDYRIGDRVFRANDRDPALPAQLAPQVQAVIGLSDLARPAPTTKAIRKAINEVICQIISLACPEVPGRRDVILELCRAQFDQNGNPNSDAFLSFLNLKCNPNLAASFRTEAAQLAPGAWLGIDGTGQKIGLLEFDTFDRNDVVDYLAFRGSPAAQIAKLAQVHVNGGAPAGANQAEVLLDIDAVLTLAPGADVVVYDAPFTGAGTSFQALLNAMVTGGVTIISNSWAYCEDQTTLADVQSIDAILANAAASGISVFNATGDTGSTCLDGSQNTVAVPADAPSATAVGGTSLKSGAVPSIYGTESSWNGAGDTPPTGQGGFGVSRFFARPAYQNGQTTSPMRSVPDVAVNADPAEGPMICQASAGGCPSGLLFGGTSVAAPIWGAFAAQLNQAQGHNIGAFNPVLYPLAATQGFHSAASLGTDFAHVGLGSPDVDALHLLLSGQTAGSVSAAVSEVIPLARRSPGSTDIPLAAGVAADGASPGYVLVQLRDANGNFIGGKTVSLAASPGSHVTIAPPSGVSTAANGAVVFTLTDLMPETVTFKATDTTDGLVLATTPTIEFEVPPAAGAVIGAFPTTVTADGTSMTTITVTLKDALNRPTPGKQITLSQGSGHSFVTAPNPSVTDASGQIHFTATDQVREVVTYTAVDVTDGDLPVPGNAQVTFNNGAGSACGNNAMPPSAAAGYVLTPFATGFAAGSLSFGNVNFNGCAGVSAPAFLGGNAFLLNFLNGDVFKLGAGGGAASSANRLGTVGPTLGWPTVGKDGSLYATRVATTGDFNTGAVLQLDPASGAVLRAVASNLRCPHSLAVDPLSGDLFFDDECFGAGADDAAIHRIRNPTAMTPTVEVYATLPATPNGKLVFAPNGSLYVVTGYTSPTPAPVVRVSGTNGPNPATVTPLTGVGSFYWVNIGEVGSNGEARSLITLTTAGLQLTDITTNPPTATTLAHNLGGGLAGPDGCLYALENTGTVVYKLGNADGSCRFLATNANPSLVLSPGTVMPNPAQGAAQTFTATLRNVDAPAGTPVFFQVAGANPRIQMVRADASGQAALTYTAAKAGSDVIVATATVSKVALTSNKAHVIWDPGKHVTFLTLNPSPTAGSAGKETSVVASLTDVSLDPPAPVPGASVQFTLGSTRCSGATDAHGLVTCQLTPSHAGMATLTAAFAGTTELLSATDAVGFNVIGLSPLQASCVPAGCDDGDSCTTDTCDNGQCRHTPPPGFAGVSCYLDAFGAALQGAARTDVRRSVKNQLRAKLKILLKLVRTAQKPGRRGTKAHRQIGPKLDALVAQLQRLRGKKFAASLADTLVAKARGARSALP
jgi:hypothetical protein